MLKRVLWTAGALAVYLAMHHVPIPVLDLEALYSLMSVLEGSVHLSRASIIALGIRPFFIAFLVVELCSLVVPVGRRIRTGGWEGRQKLNRHAIMLAVLISLIQALGLSFALEGLTIVDGHPLVPHPGWTSRLLIMLTLTATSCAAFMLFNFVSARGFGNGFCLVMTFELAMDVPKSLAHLRASDYEVTDIVSPYVAAFLISTLIVAGIHVKREPYEISIKGRTSVTFLPSFPQGVIPITLCYYLLDLPATIPPLTSPGAGSWALTPVQYLTGVIVLVPILSFTTVHFFSTRKRIESNLPRPSLPPWFDTLLRNRLYLTTAGLTAMASGYAAVELYLLGGYLSYLPDFFEMVMIVAIGIDLVDEWRFRSNHPEAERLIELDNVHLALYLRSVLRDRYVPCVVQTLHFRGLFFFLRPLYKMSVLVPADRLDEARELVNELNPRVL